MRIISRNFYFSKKCRTVGIMFCLGVRVFIPRLVKNTRDFIFCYCYIIVPPAPFWAKKSNGGTIIKHEVREQMCNF